MLLFHSLKICANIQSLCPHGMRGKAKHPPPPILHSPVETCSMLNLSCASLCTRAADHPLTHFECITGHIKQSFYLSLTLRFTCLRGKCLPFFCLCGKNTDAADHPNLSSRSIRSSPSSLLLSYCFTFLYLLAHRHTQAHWYTQAQQTILTLGAATAAWGVQDEE